MRKEMTAESLYEYVIGCECKQTRESVQEALCLDVKEYDRLYKEVKSKYPDKLKKYVGQFNRDTDVYDSEGVVSKKKVTEFYRHILFNRETTTDELMDDLLVTAEGYKLIIAALEEYPREYKKYIELTKLSEESQQEKAGKVGEYAQSKKAAQDSAKIPPEELAELEELVEYMEANKEVSTATCYTALGLRKAEYNKLRRRIREIPQLDSRMCEVARYRILRGNKRGTEMKRFSSKKGRAEYETDKVVDDKVVDDIVSRLSSIEGLLEKTKGIDRKEVLNNTLESYSSLLELRNAVDVVYKEVSRLLPNTEAEVVKEAETKKKNKSLPGVVGRIKEIFLR